MAIGINKTKRIITNVAILVKSLWIPNVNIWQRARLTDLLASKWIYDSTLKLIRAEESTLGPGVVSCEEEVESRFRIPFFGGELVLC